MFTLHSNHKGLPQSRRLKPSYSTKQATPFNRARSLAKAGSSIISSSEYLNLIEGLNMDKSLSKAPEFAVLIACRHRLFGREVTKRPLPIWRSACQLPGCSVHPQEREPKHCRIVQNVQMKRCKMGTSSQSSPPLPARHPVLEGFMHPRWCKILSMKLYH